MTGTFDARIVRKNESAKGLFITLEIEGTDYYHNGVSEFRPGTLLKLQYEELDGATGAPKEQASERELPKGDVRVIATQTAAQQGREETAALSKPHRKFSELPPSQQCAIRCSDERFWQMWRDRTGRKIHSEEEMAEHIRAGCGIETRRELDTSAGARLWWRGHEAYFQNWLLEQQHKDHVR